MINTNLLTVTVIGLLAVMSPGPDFIIVTRNSLLYSKRVGLCTAVGIALGSTWWVASSLLSWITSEFILSEQRILLKSGFLQRKALDIGIAKVQSITVEQGMLGRWLGFGTLTVRRDGGTEDRFSHIASVLQLGTHIAELLEKRDSAHRPPKG